MHRRPLSLLFILLTLTLSLQAQDVEKYGVFEYTIIHGSSGIINVWEDVDIAVTLTAPSGEIFNIGGFFYDTDIWKFRFSPNEIGTWQWQYTINGSGKTTGTFNCVDSDNEGLILINPDNPYRWIFENGEPFYPFGIQDCIEFTQYSFNELYQDNWRTGGIENLSFGAYLDTFVNSGFNLWRLNNGNCSPKLIEQLDPNGNLYDAEVCRLFDEYARQIDEHGMRIFFVIFEWSIPFANEVNDAPKMDALKRYVTYIINRYGAYADLWELANEYPANSYDDQVVTILANHIKEVDPYQPSYVSISWERAEIEALDIISPHEYQSNDPQHFDDWTISDIDDWRPYEKPILYGEMGNKNCSHESLSPFRWRVVTWSLFFYEASPAFWHQHSQDYCGSGASNLYLHEDCRKYFTIHTDWTKGFDPKAVLEQITIPSGGVRAYALSGPSQYGLYLFDYSNHSTMRSGLQVTISPQKAGIGVWTDPVTGNEVDTVDISTGGSQTLDVPPFKADIALKITFEGTGSRRNVKQYSRFKNNIRNSIGSGVFFDLFGRKIDFQKQKSPLIYIFKPRGKQGTEMFRMVGLGFSGPNRSAKN